MRVTFTKVAYTILTFYFVVSCYTGYILLRNRIWREKFEAEKLEHISALTDDDTDWNPWGEEFENEQVALSHHEPPKILWNIEPHKSDTAKTEMRKLNNSQQHTVEIWGKAAIGLYLWEHILRGPLEKRLGGVWSYGAIDIDNIKFKFRTGPGVVPDKVPKDTENLVLVLNGREPDKIDFAKAWLDHLSSLSHLKNAALVLLGNEQCNNDWIKPYMSIRGGLVKFTFLVYDSQDVDDFNFYQWPLGVATYRDFPQVDTERLPVYKERKFSCNFLGTVYKNSSRETLLDVLNSSPLKQTCYIKARQDWLPNETNETRFEFIKALSESDLTLNPVGMNTECYRIYEAMAYGSVPVVEDVMTPGNCGMSKSSAQFPLRLLKEFKAPVIYVKNWTNLPKILERERKLSHFDKSKRRKNVVLWYESFKSKMRDKFVQAIKARFFGIFR